MNRALRYAAKCLLLAAGYFGAVKGGLAFAVVHDFISLVWPASGLALVALTLDLPYFGQAKASYALGLAAPLAVAFALGADAFDRALAALGGVGAAQVGRAYWITTGAVLWLSMAA